ncbi:aminotransferase class I/II-fold pyridoxal phosphate-dependent enzyme [Dongia sedimenti]|uniref:PLP-dependent aminotransferase family protein n=1 Tax=Dongia sedimenti TaxID=3064282 RepID=A0ABU0YTK5_9PROT|nr:PLP-dependent aminotransferase family protein [Rhodospirillaceae bacterium R-7]
MNQNPIGLARAIPPRVPGFAEALKETWQDLAGKEDGADPLFRAHRYGGTDEDHAAGLSWIGTRVSPAPDPDKVTVTNGTMNSILLLSTSLVGQGNVLLTEELTFPLVHTLAEMVGVRVGGVRIDAAGMIPEDFEKKCRDLKAKAVYVNCTVHSPTAYVTPEERRREIAAIARRHGVQILEDDAQALYLDNAPASFATIAPEITWYMLGFSKYLSSGIRMSYVVAPSMRALDLFLERFRPITTWHPAPIIAAMVTRWIETGRAHQLLDQVRAEVRRRQAIASEVLSGIDGYRGSSALHFWLPAPPGVESTAFSRAIGEAGVTVRPSRLYAGGLEPRVQGIRPAVGEPASAMEARRALGVLREVYDRLDRHHA